MQGGQGRGGGRGGGSDECWQGCGAQHLLLRVPGPGTRGGLVQEVVRLVLGVGGGGAVPLVPVAGGGRVGIVTRVGRRVGVGGVVMYGR